MCIRDSPQIAATGLDVVAADAGRRTGPTQEAAAVVDVARKHAATPNCSAVGNGQIGFQSFAHIQCTSVDLGVAGKFASLGQRQNAAASFDQATAADDFICLLYTSRCV